jgi:tetratricopeptide (TPR) repeat protein
VVKGNSLTNDALGGASDYAVAALKNTQPALGVRLRRIRLARGLTQREVAAPDYTHAYISTIEAGRRQPSDAAMRHFAGRLGVDVEDLTTGRPPGIARELQDVLVATRVAASDGRLEGAEESLQGVIRRAGRHGLRIHEANAHELRGLILERSDRIDPAIEAYERAEELLRDEPAAARVGAVTGKARCLEYLGDSRYPLFVLEALKRQVGAGGADAATQAQLEAALLNAYLDAGVPRAAERSGEELERLLPRIHDEPRRGQVCLYLARLASARGKTRESNRWLADGAAAFEASGLRTETGFAHLTRGVLESRAGKLTAAERSLSRARAIFAETRNDKELSNALIELARVARLQGSVDDARAMLEDVIDRLDTSHAELLAWAHREYGLLFADRDTAVAEKHLRAALDLFDRGEEHVESATTYRMLGDVLRADGREEAAFEAYSAGIHRLPVST